MDWPNELWIKLYVRDSADWLSMSFDEQAVLVLLLRKADRSGNISLGSRGTAAIPRILGHQGEAGRILSAIDGLCQIGTIQIHESHLSIPNYEAAQKVRSSSRARKAAERARKAAAKAARDARKNSNASHPNVTPGHSMSHGVTGRHDEMRRDEMRCVNTNTPAAQEGGCAAESEIVRWDTKPGSGGLEANQVRQELLAVWGAYPRRREGKKAALEHLEAQISASSDPRSTLRDIVASARAYMDMVKDEGREVHMIKSFLSFAKSWEDYVPDEPAGPALRSVPSSPPAETVISEEDREANRAAASAALAALSGGLTVIK